MKMVSSRVILAASALLVAALVIHAAGAQKTDVYNGGAILPGKTIDCGKACTGRCSLSSRPNLCKRACGSCCSKCSCVPPGTAGNFEACPCYAGLTTRNFVRKCP